MFPMAPERQMSDGCAHLETKMGGERWEVGRAVDKWEGAGK